MPQNQKLALPYLHITVEKGEKGNSANEQCTKSIEW